VGPRLAPDPLPIEVFINLVRRPVGVMPVYSAAVLSDRDIADIHAYLSAIPEAKSARDIPLLNQ
jgi:ubiquinol-cytochrome c reductase cytochrome c subunit